MASAERASNPPSSREGGSRRHRRRQRTAVRSRFDGAMLAALCALVWGSLLAIGSVHLPSLIAVAALATAAAALAFASGRLERVPPQSAISVLLSAYTLLQALPLPLSVVEALSPVAGDTWSRSLRPFGESPALAALSLAPLASVVEALKWWTYGCTFVLGTAVCRARGPKIAIAVVFAAGALAAMITLVHGVVGATELFGLYDPTFVPGRWVVGPLLNTNNLSGYLNLAIFCGVGLMLGSQTERYRYAIALGLMLLIGVSLLAASRGGVLGLLLGSVLLVPLGLWLRRSGTPLSRGTVGALVSFGVVGLALALVGATRETWRALYDTNLAKLEISVWAKPMILDHLWFGVGRGAFETVLPAYHPVTGHVSYSHAENFLAQWASEWGVVVTALALGGLAWAFRLARLQVRRSTSALVAAVGVIALLAQNLVDLALEVPAVVIALTLVLAGLTKDSADAPLDDSNRRAQRLGVLTALIGTLLVLAGAVFGTRSVGQVRRDLHDRFRALDSTNAAARDAFRDQLRREMARFPGEPYFPLLGALVAWHSNADPIPWLNRTLERNQSASRAHLLLAQVLKRKGAANQAMLELRLAIEADPDIAVHAAQLAVSWSKDIELLRRVIPADRSGIEPIVTIVRRLPGREYDRLRDELLTEALRRDPNSTRVLSAHAAHLLDSLSTGAERCEKPRRGACILAIEHDQRRLEQLDPGGFAAAEVAAKLLVIEGKPERAEAMLAQYCFGSSQRSPCLRLRMLVAAETKNHDLLVRAAKDYATAGCNGPSDCHRVAGWIGAYLSKHGYHSAALTYLERVARDAPTVESWLAVADCAEKTGAMGRQIDALRRAQRLPEGKRADVQKRLDRALASNSRLLLDKVPAIPPVP
jgi:hypothetical protein